MIGIYQDDFVEYLKDNLGEPVDIKTKNIVCRCPWCEYGKPFDRHFHCWISIEAPIFNCFEGGCNHSGSIWKLVKKISGTDISAKFVDKEAIKQNLKNQTKIGKPVIKSVPFKIPVLNEPLFSHKSSYIKQRLKFSKQDLSSLKNLVFDINTFIDINNVVVDEKLFRVRDYLHSNFVGFVTENFSTLILRNIDHFSEFKFFKLDLQETNFLDYYKIRGGNINERNIVLSEGIFDILTEHIFDDLKIRDKVSLYAAALSTSYKSLIKSIIYNEQLFQPNVHILSDRDVKIDYYKKLKKFNSHLFKSITVYYNKAGKDFNNRTVSVEKIII